MFKVMIAAAISGIMQQLHMNPRNVRLYFINDEGEHIIARIDAKEVQRLMTRSRKRRALRIQMGDVAYEIELGR